MIDIRRNDSGTLWQRWQRNAERNPDREAIVHWVAGEEPVRWTYKNLIETAKKYAIKIREAGIKQGDVCAIIMHHNPMFYPLYLGISRVGALPAVLAYPNPRLHPDKFRQGIEGMSQRSGLDYILTEQELDQIIHPLMDKPGCTIRSVFFPLEWEIKNDIDPAADYEIEQIALRVKETDPMLLQHSSGTTGLQKPIVLSHRAILDHVNNLGCALELTEKDKIASWLPLYHDFGLIACFQIPLAYGITTIQINPFEWVLAPVLLLDVITKERATITCLPNFAYNVLADKIHDEDLCDISLESLRLVLNGAEPIRHISHKKFAERFQKYRFNPLALSCIYGMAEVTLCLVTSVPGLSLTELFVDRNELSRGVMKFADNNSATRVCVSTGRLINGCEIKIVDEYKNELPDGIVGEILAKSVSMFDGYRNYPEKTAEVLQDGWYLSGDYGFRYKDEFYIIGRKKDLIIVAGKNIYPEDVEDAINQVKGIIPGRVISFGEEDEQMGTEHISVVAETRVEDDKGRNALRMDILTAGMAIDVNISKVYLVPPRWLIKSSAGKPSRKANKERITCREDTQVWSR
jgi:fatty-acyl-CoA synthase